MAPDVATIREMLQAITGREFEQQQVTEQTSYLDDLALTSIQTVDLIMHIEDRYGIEIEDTDLAKLRTVGQTIHYVREKTPSQ